jgi:hypothetical protein
VGEGPFSPAESLSVTALPCSRPSPWRRGQHTLLWLLLRGRMIPVALAWLGVLASVLLVVILPLQLAGLLGGPMTWFAWVTWLQWLPMLVFEVALALWLIIKGVGAPRREPGERSQA